MNIRINIFYYYVITLLSPLFGVFLAIRNLPWWFRKSVLILTITLFGATIILPEGADGYKMNQSVEEHYGDISFNQWLFELKKILIFSPEPGTKGDVFSHAISYLLGSILMMPQLYFTLVSFIFGYFFINGLSKIFQTGQIPSKSLLAWSLVIILITYRFLDTMQTVRTWTGLWILFNGVLGYHQTGKKKYLLLMLAAPMIHVAYFAMALPAYAIVFFKWIKPEFFIIAYIFSFFLSINHGVIINQLVKSDLGSDKVASYYREEGNYNIDERKIKASNFYVKYGKGWALSKAPNFLAFSLIIFGFYSKRKMTSLELSIFSTGILMATMANFMSFIPALYFRTSINAGIYIIATSVLLLLRGELLKGTGWLFPFRIASLWISIFIFVPYLIYVFANMIQFTSMYMILFPFFSMFSELNFSIRELISYFFY